MKNSVKIISRNAIIAALYVVFTLITYPFSFAGIQFRFAEILILLCFFRKDYAFGLTIGCVIANLFSSLGMFDALFGGLATLLACLCICFSKHLVVAILFPILFNSFIVGFELFYFMEQAFWVNVLWVAIGEAVVMLFGYVLFMSFKHKPSFYRIINAKQNIDFRF